MNMSAVNSQLSLLHGKIKTSKWATICLLVLLGAAGRYAYDHWKDKADHKEVIIKTFIITHHCGIVATGYAQKLGFTDTPESCVKDGMDSIAVYANIKDDDRKLQFLVDTCRSGMHSLLSEADCKQQAWKALYGDN